MCISYFRVHINVGYVTEGLVVVAMLACCSWGEPNTSKTSRVELPAFNNLILSFMMNKSYFIQTQSPENKYLMISLCLNDCLYINVI